MNIHFEYDVLIVGGGPAGVICAITVAKSGFKVVILDKKSKEKIGDKTCGDVVDNRAIQKVNDEIGVELPRDAEISDIIDKMSIAAGNIHQKFSLSAPGYVVDRHKYGQRLLNEAEKLGVHIISSATVRDVIIEEIEGEKYIQGVKYFHEKDTKILTAKFTIDASGAYAVIRKKLPDELLIDGITHELSKDQIWISYREIIELEEQNHNFAHEILLLYNENIPPPGYFWIFSKGNRKLNCGIGWLKTQKLGKMKSVYSQEMKNYFTLGSYKIVKSGGGKIPVRPPFDSLVFNGGALVGDAACMVHPLTAEGHGPAINTAMHCGKELVNAIKHNDRTKQRLWGYNIAISQHYGLKHTRAYIMRKFMEKAGVKNFEYLIKKQIFRTDEIDIIFHEGELRLSIMDTFKRISKLMFKPRLILLLRELFKSIDHCTKIYTKYPVNSSELSNWRKERNKKLKLNF